MSNTRPIIGIVGAHFARPSGVHISGIGEHYFEAIEGAGGIPLLIHLTHDSEVLDRLYGMCDGLVFAGGGDIDPAYFGERRHPKLGEIEVLRDEVELPLARRALAEELPLLGICRGIQLLNVAMGGTLYQDIGSELPDALNHRESSAHPVRGYLAHPIRITPDSWLAGQLGVSEVAVNTHHHQSIDAVAPGLRVVGYAPDGIVEAVEGTGASFIAAVQCHPEDLWNASEPRWASFFAGFIEQVRQ